jgi:class 3 adenylate cyclase/pimeloyl-ACP methyl ester carboxylesterase
VSVPEIHYARTSDGVSLAYQVLGVGPIDLVYVPGCESNIELNWDYPPLARCLRRLSSFSRLITMDRRGTGCSDRLSLDELPSLEMQADDLRVVMDDAGSARAALLAFDAGNILAAWFAATTPERVTALILNRPFARGTASGDYPWAMSPQEWDSYLAEMAQGWGTRPYAESFLRWIAPSEAGNMPLLRWFDRYLRQSVSPAAAVALEALCRDTDIRSVLPMIQVPTLVLHHSEDPMEPVEGGRWVAGQIPDARFVELPGLCDPMLGLPDSDVDHVQEFLTGTPHQRDWDRVLATVLFTDIVSSTERQAAIGDRAWKELVEDHHALVRVALERWRGVENDTAGDGFYATFDAPARAVRCALEIADQVKALGIEIRAGIHTGECEIVDGKYGGIAVATGSRITALAAASEVLVSQTVKDLVAGSGLAFEDHGERSLKGVPDRCHLYAAQA